MTPQQPSTAGTSELAKAILERLNRVYFWNHLQAVDEQLQPLRDAVEKRIEGGHSFMCRVFPLWNRGDCTCGHDALVAAAAMLRVVLPGSGGEETATRKERT